MDLINKYLFKKVIFISGNFKGLTGICTKIELNSNEEKAIYGIKITFEMSNKTKGFAYKSEHFELLDSKLKNTYLY